MFTPHCLLPRLTFPTSAVIIRELEQMAAELAEKRKISFTAATCWDQVLPSSARQEDDISRDQRVSCHHNLPERLWAGHGVGTTVWSVTRHRWHRSSARLCATQHRQASSQQALWKPAPECNTAPVVCPLHKHLHAVLCCLGKTKTGWSLQGRQGLCPLLPSEQTHVQQQQRL